MGAPRTVPADTSICLGEFKISVCRRPFMMYNSFIENEPQGKRKEKQYLTIFFT